MSTITISKDSHAALVKTAKSVKLEESEAFAKAVGWGMSRYLANKNYDKKQGRVRKYEPSDEKVKDGVKIKCDEETEARISKYAKETKQDESVAASNLFLLGDKRWKNLRDFGKAHKGEEKVKVKPAKAKEAEPTKAAKPKTERKAKAAVKPVKAKAPKAAPKPRVKAAKTAKAKPAVEPVVTKEDVKGAMEAATAPAGGEPEPTPVTGLTVAVGDYVLDCDPRRRVVKRVTRVDNDGYVQVQAEGGPASNIPLAKIHREPSRKKGYALVEAGYTEAAGANGAAA